jgi:hypothetical protein
MAAIVITNLLGTNEIYQSGGQQKMYSPVEQKEGLSTIFTFSTGICGVKSFFHSPFTSHHSLFLPFAITNTLTKKR